MTGQIDGHEGRNADKSTNIEARTNEIGKWKEERGTQGFVVFLTIQGLGG